MKNTLIVSVTVPQRDECIAAISTAARNGATLAIEDLIKADSLSDSETFQQEVIARQGELNALVRESIREIVKRKIAEMVQKIVGCLKLLSAGEELELDPTDGTETIVNAADVFTAGIDEDFGRWGTNAPSGPTDKTKTQVFEMAKDGNFQAIFTGVNPDLDKLCLEQSQIKAFVRKHKKWLRTEGYATLFLFKVGEGVKKQYFVACVDLRSDGPDVDVFRFSDPCLARPVSVSCGAPATDP